jgi:hypothetical protein
MNSLRAYRYQRSSRLRHPLRKNVGENITKTGKLGACVVGNAGVGVVSMDQGGPAGVEREVERPQRPPSSVPIVFAYATGWAQARLTFTPATGSTEPAWVGSWQNLFISTR